MPTPRQEIDEYDRGRAEVPWRMLALGCATVAMVLCVIVLISSIT